MKRGCNGDGAVSILKSICRHWIAKYYTNLLAAPIVRFQSANARRSSAYKISNWRRCYPSLSSCSVHSAFYDAIEESRPIWTSEFSCENVSVTHRIMQENTHKLLQSRQFLVTSKDWSDWIYVLSYIIRIASIPDIKTIEKVNVRKDCLSLMNRSMILFLFLRCTLRFLQCFIFLLHLLLLYVFIIVKHQAIR